METLTASPATHADGGRSHQLWTPGASTGFNLLGTSYSPEETDIISLV